MNYAQQIVNTFKNSTVERILVVDDAYDFPKLDSQSAGGLLEILEGGLSEELSLHHDIEAATKALYESDFEHEAVSTVLGFLYGAYVESRNSDFDPNGFFKDTKEGALQSLDPLVKLLEQSIDNLTIVKAGTGDETIRAYLELKPHIIFMDFFMSPPERATHETKSEGKNDRNRSIDLLNGILSKYQDFTPAVVLMSSEDVAQRKDAYRSRLEGRVMALRFGFLYKSWIRHDGEELLATGDAADVLMDTSGSFEFGAALESALKAWKEGAKEGLDKLYSDLREYDIKDFAYLLRFRLYDEECFADYVEWLLGESLRAVVDEKVNWTAQDFMNLNDKKLTEAIEGAHPLPSNRIARTFDQVRFNSRKNRPRNRFALGDVFISGKFVRMVISPDCDLISRNNEKPKASRLLTVGGKILGLEENGTSANELIYINEVPKTIKWNFKDLMTHEFGDVEKLDIESKDYRYFRSMRPIYAQIIQKEVLAKLSRIGVAVPPIVYVGAPVKVLIKKKIGNQEKSEEIEDLEEAYAQVLMARGGHDCKFRVLFTRKFVWGFIEKVVQTDPVDLDARHHECLQMFIDNQGGIRKSMLRKGLELPGHYNCQGESEASSSDNNIFRVAIGLPQKIKFWLEIRVDIKDEALLDLSGIDPLTELQF